MNIFKTIAATATALIISSTAMAHDPKMHAAEDQMNCKKMAQHMEMMEKMDHSKMDMKDPAMKAMMANMSKMKQMYQKHCAITDSKT